MTPKPAEIDDGSGLFDLLAKEVGVPRPFVAKFFDYFFRDDPEMGKAFRKQQVDYGKICIQDLYAREIRKIVLGGYELEAQRRIMEHVRKLVSDAAYEQEHRDLSGDLTEAEREVLKEGGYDEIRDLGVEADPLTRTEHEYAALVETALSVKEAAERLGVDMSRVRQRLRQPATLYGFKSFPDQWVLPSFQFTEKGEVPGIAEVFKCLDPGLHPISVVTWFYVPNTDLFIDDETEDPVSPIQWLSCGYDPARVATLASQL